MPQNRLTVPTKPKIIDRAAVTLCISRYRSKLAKNKDHGEEDGWMDHLDDLMDEKRDPCRRCKNDCAELYSPLLTAYSDLLDVDGFVDRLYGIFDTFVRPPAVD